MFRALLWKEWRQLRLLRWAGCGIGLLMPALLLALAELGRRGWLLASISGYSAATVVQEVLPAMLALAVWPLLALMTSAQAFTADRADGTDAFLLQRPVRRSLVWRARGAAVLGTAVAVLASHVGTWWLAVRWIGHPAAFDESNALGRLLLQGGTATAVALLAGLAAAAFARSPVQAVLLGLVLIAIPVAVGALLTSGLFWGYRIRDFPVGALVPVVLLVGYVVSSFRVECAGEPAGRGRLRRGLPILATALLAVPLFVAGSAPIVVRWDARLALGNTTVIAASTGNVALVLNNYQRAAWLIDTASRETLRFFPTPVYDACWSGDGSRLALLHAAGTAGRHLRDLRIEVFDPSGARAGDPIVCEECRGWWDSSMFWVAGNVVLRGFDRGRDAILIVDPLNGTKRAVEVPGPVHKWMLLDPRGGKRLHILRLLRPRVDASGLAEGGPRLVGDVHRLDIENASLGPAIEVPDPGSTYQAVRSLSTSGEAWLRFPERRGEVCRVLHLATGEADDLPTKQAVWLNGDRLAWIERTDRGSVDLVVGQPGEPRRLGALTADWVWFTPSPDGTQLLITGTLSGEPGVYRRWVFDTETDGLEPLVADLDEETDGLWAVQWATHDRFALVEPGSVSLPDPETGVTTAVLGRR